VCCPKHCQCVKTRTELSNRMLWATSSLGEQGSEIIQTHAMLHGVWWWWWEGGGGIWFLIKCLRISLSMTSSSKLMNGNCVQRPCTGPCPHRDRDYRIGSNFGKFYLIRTNFTLGETVSLVKVFRLFRMERIFLVFRVWTELVDVQHLIYWQAQGIYFRDDYLLGTWLCIGGR
jgi:hypothetical protein